MRHDEGRLIGLDEEVEQSQRSDEAVRLLRVSWSLGLERKECHIATIPLLPAGLGESQWRMLFAIRRRQQTEKTIIGMVANNASLDL